MQPVHTNYPFYNYQELRWDAITVSETFWKQTQMQNIGVAAVTFLRTLTKMF